MVAQTQHLQLKQSQSLVMTPQLQQSLKLLQMATMDVAGYVEQELAQNPLLEVDEGQAADQAPAEEKPRESTENLETTDLTDSNEFRQGDLDTDFSTTWDGEIAAKDTGPIDNPHARQDYALDRDQYFERIISEEITLRDHLMEQIGVDITEPAERIIALHLLDMLDENGYLFADFSALAEVLQCDVSSIESTLAKCQRLEPAGVFARSLAECLKLQLIDKNRFDPAIEKLLNHLDLLGKHEMVKLKRICNVKKDELEEMIAEIRELNPKPAYHFAEEMVQTAHIDINVTRKPDGSWAVELNNEALPKLLVNNRYYSEVKHRSKGEADKKYLSEQYQSANWLVRSLNQRAETILKVASELISQQQDFLEKGVYHLKPLVYRDIAEKLEIHESTVGRVAQGKYMATPRGVYELKYFFTSSVGSKEEGDEMSSTAVKHAIAELIENETAKAVLSDDKIAQLLNDKGIHAARRTVAKYRESMNIPSSAQRKRIKRMAG